MTVADGATAWRREDLERISSAEAMRLTVPCIPISTYSITCSYSSAFLAEDPCLAERNASYTAPLFPLSTDPPRSFRVGDGAARIYQTLSQKPSQSRGGGLSPGESRGARQVSELPRSPSPLENRTIEQPLTCNFSVELRGFEPLAPSMRTRCATGLRYSPENLS